MPEPYCNFLRNLLAHGHPLKKAHSHPSAMAFQSDSIAQKRYKRLARQNYLSGHLFLAKPAVRSSITSRTPAAPTMYSHKPKPLSLTGRQFKAEIYGMSSNDIRCDDSADGLPTAATRDQDSSYEKSLSPNNGSIDQASDVTSKTGYMYSNAANYDKAPSSAASDIEQPTIMATKVPRRALRNGNCVKSNATPRRLPVGELFCISSLSPLDNGVEPVSTTPDVQVQDPIADSSDHNLSTRTLSTFKIVMHDSTTSLSTFRGALKKSNVIPKGLKRTQRVGDGFEVDEMRTTHQIMQKRRKRKQFVIPNIKTLQLSTGPLLEAHTEVFHSDQNLKPISYAQNETAQKNFQPSIHDHPTRASRRTSFNDTDDVIVAQLASVWAPRRPQTDSEEETFEEEDESEEDERLDGNSGLPALMAQRNEDIDDESLFSEDELPSEV